MYEKNVSLEQFEPPPRGYSVLTGMGLHRDTPALSENQLNLFTLPYAQLIVVIADSLFPPNIVIDSCGTKHTIRASESNVDRFICFRSAWQPDFGTPLQLAFRDLTEASLNMTHGKAHFVLLQEPDQIGLLRDLQEGKVASANWRVRRDQSSAFRLIYRAIAEGLFADPGYGGNSGGAGWYYSNFMTIAGAS